MFYNYLVTVQSQADLSIWQIRHTDEMQSILEVGFEHLHKSYHFVSIFTRYCVIICSYFSKKNATTPLFCDEMTLFSPFMQFVTVFIPALAGNPSISVTAHLLFLHSVSHPTGITYSRSVPKMSGNR